MIDLKKAPVFRCKQLSFRGDEIAISPFANNATGHLTLKEHKMVLLLVNNEEILLSHAEAHAIVRAFEMSILWKFKTSEEYGAI